MVKVKITAGGIYGLGGKELEVGDVLDLETEPTGWVGRYEVISDGKTEGKTAVTNPAKFGAKAKGDQFVIVDAKGKEVGKPMSEADAKAFQEMSDEDKAAFATEHGKA